MEPSSRRHIYEFVCGEPFEKEGKFILIYVAVIELIRWLKLVHKKGNLTLIFNP